MSESKSDLGALFNKAFLNTVDLTKYKVGNPPSYDDHMKAKQKIIDNLTQTRDQPQRIDCRTVYDQKDIRKIYSTKKKNVYPYNNSQNSLSEHVSQINLVQPSDAKSEVSVGNDLSQYKYLQQATIPEQTQNNILPKLQDHGSTDNMSAIKSVITPTTYQQIPTPGQNFGQHIIGTTPYEHISSRSQSIDISTGSYHPAYQQINTPQDQRFQQQDISYPQQNNMYLQQQYSHASPPLQQYSSSQSIQTYQPLQPSQTLQPYQQVQYQHPHQQYQQHHSQQQIHQQQMHQQQMHQQQIIQQQQQHQQQQQQQHQQHLQHLQHLQQQQPLQQQPQIQQQQPNQHIQPSPAQQPQQSQQSQLPHQQQQLQTQQQTQPPQTQQPLSRSQSQSQTQTQQSQQPQQSHFQSQAGGSSYDYSPQSNPQQRLTSPKSTLSGEIGNVQFDTTQKDTVNKMGSFKGDSQYKSNNIPSFTSEKSVSSGRLKQVCGLDLSLGQQYIDNFKLYSAHNEQVNMEFAASLDGKFFVNSKYLKLDDGDDTFPIACYRRNFNTMLISLFFSDTPRFIEIGGVFYEISSINLSLDAKSNFSDQPIELSYFTVSNSDKYTSNFIVMDDSSIDLDVFSQRKNIKMQRFQFKKATPNNGKNIAKDYYYLYITLSFNIVSSNSEDPAKRKLPYNQKIMTLKTNGISVRGRNPSFYTERNDESIRKDSSVCYKLFHGIHDQ